MTLLKKQPLIATSLSWNSPYVLFKPIHTTYYISCLCLDLNQQKIIVLNNQWNFQHFVILLNIHWISDI